MKIDGTQPDQPRFAIVSGGDEIRLRSYVNHRIYAHERGFDYRLECGIDQGIKNKFYYKMSIINRILPLYEWIVWIDDDAFFTDFEATNLEDFIARAEAENKFLVIAEGAVEPNGWWSKINTGVFILRNDERGRRLMKMMMDSDLAEVQEWWEEDRDGLFTNGDQDQMWWALNASGLIEDTIVVDQLQLNSRGHFYHDSLQDAFVMHFAGHRDKPLGIARFANRFEVGHELVPVDLLDKYGVAVRSPMTDVEYKARAARQEAIGRTKRFAKPLVHKFREIRARRSGA